MYTLQEYYVTMSLVCIRQHVHLTRCILYLETESGDLYWCSFEATSIGSME